jgi:hypothetical protein
MSRLLHLVSPGSDLSKFEGTIGLLHEFAPDSPWLQAAKGPWHTPDELLGSPDEALAQVHPLVSRLLQSAPLVEGFSPLTIFEETLLEQCSYIAQASNLDRWISDNSFSTCRFDSYSPWVSRLRKIQSVTGSSYRIDVRLGVMESGQRVRALGRLWKTKPGVREFFRRVAPLRARYLSGGPQRKNRGQDIRGGIWFVSTAYNYTKIGLAYEPYLGQPMNYLVEDPASGAKRLQELGRDWHLLYAWSRRSDIPSASEVRSIGDKITAALAAVPIDEEQNRLRTTFLQGEWWQLFLTRRFPFVLFLSRVLQRWFQTVQPEMIVVGNAGYERALLLHENVRRVPVVMLQHGIMHWVYGVADQPVDVFVLRGSFFQQVLNEPLRRKTVIRNFPEPQQRADLPAAKSEERDSILFITTPYDVPAMYHEEDRQDILRAILRAAHSAKKPLIVRVHPLEKISDYERLVHGLEDELGLQVGVSYSQGPDVEQALARSGVAVLHFSTMFLDCLRHGIPIVSFGWHWFPNKAHFQEERIFHFARDLQEVEFLIGQGLAGQLPRSQAMLEKFLASTKAEEISAMFQETLRSKEPSYVGPHRPS